jgi:hypothetical protein
MYIKKVFSIIILILLANTAYSQTIEIAFEKPVQIFNNSIGREWTFYYSIKDIQYSLYSRAQIKLDNSVISLQIYAREEDSIPDIGSATVTIDPKKMNSDKVNTYEVIISVRENGGRYKGNEAQWKMCFSTKSIE